MTDGGADVAAQGADHAAVTDAAAAANAKKKRKIRILMR